MFMTVNEWAPVEREIYLVKFYAAADDDDGGNDDDTFFFTPFSLT